MRLVLLDKLGQLFESIVVARLGISPGKCPAARRSHLVANGRARCLEGFQLLMLLLDARCEHRGATLGGGLGCRCYQLLGHKVVIQRCHHQNLLLLPCGRRRLLLMIVLIRNVVLQRHCVIFILTGFTSVI